MNVYAYGHDFGNSDTCSVLISNGKHLYRRIPSFTAGGDYENFTRTIGRPKEGEYIYSDASTELYVGKLALEQSTTPDSTADDIHRYTNPQSLYTMLTSAASLLPDEHVFGLHVVTGLPVETHQKNPELRRAIPRFLESGSPYHFQLNGVEKTIHVTCSLVLPEGAAALAEHGKKGDYTKAVVDIGGRTTDLYVVRGQRPVLDACRHMVAGVQKAIDRFNAQFEKQHGRLLDPFDLTRVLTAYNTSRKKEIPITVNGRQVLGAVSLLEQSMIQEGNKIASFVAKRWSGGDETGKVASSYDDVLLIGGGVYYFGDMLRVRIPHSHIIEKVVPEMANADSYALTAQRLLERKQADSIGA